MAEKLSDRVKHFFTINEFFSFVDMGHRGAEVSVGGKTVTLEMAPGLKLSPGELNQVRHHAVLAHGLAVQAIRAKGKTGTKVGPAENINVLVPLIETARAHQGRGGGHARGERPVPDRHARRQVHRRAISEGWARTRRSSPTRT